MAMDESFDIVPWWFWALFVGAIVFNLLVVLHRRGYINLPCCSRQNGGSHFQQGQPAVAIELGAPGAAAPPASQFVVHGNGASQPYGAQHQQPPTYTYYGQQQAHAVPVAPTYGVPAPVAPTAQHPAVTYASQQPPPPVAPTAQHAAVTYAYTDASPVLGQAPDLGPGGYGK